MGLEENKETKQTSIKRYITGWIAGLVALAGFLSGGVYLLLLLLVVTYFVTKEYRQILNNKGFYPSLSLMHTANICYALLVFLGGFDFLSLAVTLSIIASFLVVLFKGRQPYIANVATTTLGFMYGSWLPCHILLLRQYGSGEINFFKVQTNEGLYLATVVFLAVVVTDIGAYFFGSRHGKHKLAEVISPKKTVEGAIGGGICAILVSLTGTLYTELTLLQSAILGLAVTVSAQLGDLSESLIKRDAGVKDSSDMLPGHGGFLDRIDGYIFALPVAYYYILYFTHGNNLFFDFFEYIKGVISVWM